MGTNYYWHEKPACGSCKREYEELHIGKSSAGWCFALHVYPEGVWALDQEMPVRDLGDWKTLFAVEGSHITDEYQRPVTVEEMLSVITERRSNRKPGEFWYSESGAMEGPNNLARSRVVEGHVIGHGAGTWDLCIGDFL